MAKMKHGRLPKPLKGSHTKEHPSETRSLLLVNGGLQAFPCTHYFRLGAVDLDFAHEVKNQLFSHLAKSSRKLVTDTGVAIDEALARLRLPKGREVHKLTEGLSEIRLQPKAHWRDPEQIKRGVGYALEEDLAVEFGYFAQAPGFKTPEPHTRQVTVKSVSVKGFTARHSRGIREYRWDRVDYLTPLATEGYRRRNYPELMIELSYPHEPDFPEVLAGMLILDIHQLGAKMKLEKPGWRSRSLRLARAWG